MNELILYQWCKMLHIAALIFWLGPSLGAWWLLRTIRTEYGDKHIVSQLVYPPFIVTLWVEHVAFVMLLISGITMTTVFHLFAHPWLQWKLAALLFLILPLEVADFWLGNIKLHQLFSSVTTNAQFQKFLYLYHKVLTPVAIIILPVSVLLIFWLVVTKPHLPLLIQ